MDVDIGSRVEHFRPKRRARPFAFLLGEKGGLALSDYFLWTKDRTRTLLYLTGMAFLVSALAFVNCYPFVYSDTGTYIRCAFTLLPAPDRPIGYSFIIRAVTWQSTLWTVVLFQGGMFAWLLYEILKRVLPVGASVRKVHLIVTAVLMVTSSMPWYMAQIMPDALTPLIVMILYLLLFGGVVGLGRSVFLWSCLFFFLLAHFSHVAMTLLFLVLLAVHRSLWSVNWYGKAFWCRWRGVLATLLACVVFASWYNGRHGLRPVFSPSSNVFLAGKLCQGDVMRSFLDAHCGDKDYPLCPYKDELPDIPGNIIWPENSVLNRMHLDIASADTVLAPLIHDVLLDPASLAMFLRTGIIDTFKQFFQINAGSGLISYHTDSAPYNEIRTHLPWERTSYITSRQAYNGWNFELLNIVVHLVFLLSLVVIGLLWGQAKANKPLLQVAVLFLAWTILNAMVTGGLANVYDRLQARVAWLIVLTACLMVASSARGTRWISTMRGDGA